jgi:MFS family permease
MSNPSNPVQSASIRRVLFASLVGTAVEFYDFYIYATAASLVFGALFFPSTSPAAQLLASYASFGIAFLARPIGAIAFGHFGDRIGRKSTLVASLLMMGGSTLAIGFLPTYGSVGWVAPLLLCVMRFGQGFGLGGEWGGAALLAVENAPPGYRARFGMFPQLGAPVGFIAANGLFLILGLFLTPAQFVDWGWRLPFLASSLLVGIGLWVRLKLTETKDFAAALAEAPPTQVPLVELLRFYPRETFAGTFAAISCFAIFYLGTVFALGYGTTTLGYDRRTFLSVLLAAIPFLAVGIVASSALSDRTNPRRILMIGGGLTVIAGGLFAPMLGAGSLPAIWLLLSFMFLVMGVVYGPLGTWLPGLFPARVRYTGASLAFTLGGIIGGGIAPILALKLSEIGGLPYVGLYLGGAGLISLLALFLLKKPTAGANAVVAVPL